MRTILEGQISFGGVQDALAAVARHKNIKYGVLRISSNQASGLIGIFCGRFITGAFVSLTGATGHKALQQLIAATDGEFAFMDAMGYETPELKQALGIDISSLCAEDTAGQLVSEQSLTPADTSEKELVRLIDTSADFDEHSTVLNDSELASRLKRTYDKILSVSEFEKMRRATAAEGAFSGDEQEDISRRRREPAPSTPVELTDIINSRGQSSQTGTHQKWSNLEFDPAKLRSKEYLLRSCAPPLSKDNSPEMPAPPAPTPTSAVDEEEETLVHAFGTVSYINETQQELIENSDDDSEQRWRQNRKSTGGDFNRLKQWPSRSRTISKYALLILAVIASLCLFLAYQTSTQKRISKPAAGKVSDLHHASGNTHSKEKKRR